MKTSKEKLELKIKIVKRAIEIIKRDAPAHKHRYAFGICDGISFARRELEVSSMVDGYGLNWYGIKLPTKKYPGTLSNKTLIFCYPTTRQGMLERIKVLKKVLAKLKAKQ